MSLGLRMLGRFEVLVDGAVVALPPSRKTRALLAWLALAERPQRRERLCEIFWEVPDDPKGALRWSLSKIRRIVGEAEAARLRADRSTVALDTAGVETDAARVLGLAPDAIETMPDETLETIAASFRGGFLEDLALDRAPEFEAWRTALGFETETARGRVLAALAERLGDDPARALPYAEQLAALAPDDRAAAARVQLLRKSVRQALSTAIASSPPATARASSADRTPEATRPAAPDTTESPDIRYAIASDGTRIAWAMNGQGPPLVRAAHWMSHLAYDCESPVWRHWVREPSAISTFVRYDERCNGLSDPDAEDLSLDAFVSDLEAVVDAAGLDRFTLLGVSQSCAISVAYALRHPERVQGLILYGGYAQGWRARGDPEEIAKREAILVLMREGWGRENPMFGALFAAMFVPAASREKMAEFAELQRRTVTPRNAIRLQNAFALLDVKEDLAGLRVPTLVIHATDDLVAPIASGRTLAEGIPGARFVELDSANHILLGDEPAFGRFISEVRGFLEEWGRERTPGRSEGTSSDSSSRRSITILDAEIVSPLGALHGLGEEDQAVELARLVTRIRGRIEAQGGLVIDSGSNWVSAAFGAAMPSEVHAVDACRTALELRSLVETASAGSARLRVGIDSGEAVIAFLPELPAVAGALPQRARRLTQSLRSAVIALSDEAAASAGGYVSFSAIRSMDVTGGRRGRRIFELKALRQGRSRWHLRAERQLTAFTGRVAEMDLLMRCLGLAASGQGRAIFVSGEAGVGKSRLAQEFLGRCPGQGAATVEAGALEFDHDVPFAMIRRLLAGLLGLDMAEGGRAVPDEVRASLAALDATSLETPVLFALDLATGDAGWASMLPTERAYRVREALRRLVALRARARPLVVVAEDLHWCDEASLAAIARLVEGLERLPIVLLATARPEFRPDWLQRSVVKPVNLDVLGAVDAHKLVRTLVGRHPSVGVLRRLLVERTDGTPLAIEETVGALVQSGRLTGRPGAYVAPRPIVEIEPVASVAPVIAARIARLGACERQLLQLAAVIGRDGPLGLLATLTALAPEAFDAALRAVERGEFLYELIGNGEPAFTFKHALIRDAAYASILDGRRRDLHRLTFEALARLPQATRDGMVEQLAHHAYLAGDWQGAVAWLIRAAGRAIERSAYDRAVGNLERAAGALDAFEPTPENVAAGIDVRITMQIAYAALGNFEAAVARIAEACEMAEAAGEAERLAQALLKLSYTFGTCGRLDEALAAAERLAAHARANGLEIYSCESDMAAGFALLMRGDARSALDRLLPHERRFDGPLRNERLGLLNTRAVWLKGCIAQAAAMLGELARAEAALAEALAVARETGRPQDRNASLQFALQVEIARGPSDSRLAEAETMLAETLDEWLFPAGPWLLCSLADALMARGRLAAAESVLERAWEAADAAGMRGIAAVAARLLAAVQARRGGADARAELEERLHCDEDIPVWLQTRMRRALAETTPDDATAVRLLRAAADQARAAGLLPDETHCLAELADRLAKLDPDASARAKRDAEALRGRMAGLVAAE